MRKFLIPIIFSAMCLVSLPSCDKETEGVTFVEDFPTITDADGNNFETVNLALGESFSPNYKAVMGDKDVTNSVHVSILDMISNQIVDNVSTDAPGMYVISYSAESEHGYGEWTATQTVYVYNPDITLDISGTWSVDEMLTVSQDLGGRIEPTDDTQKYCSFVDFFDFFGTSGPISITISQIVPGFFSISDYYFGWYEYVRGYGEEYRATGYFSLNDDNTLSHISSSTPWGDSISEFSGSYDPENNTISFSYDYVGSVNIKGVIKAE